MSQCAIAKAWLCRGLFVGLLGLPACSLNPQPIPEPGRDVSLEGDSTSGESVVGSAGSGDGADDVGHQSSQGGSASLGSGGSGNADPNDDAPGSSMAGRGDASAEPSDAGVEGVDAGASSGDLGFEVDAGGQVR